MTQDSNGLVMPVSPMGGYGNGFGDLGSGGWWIILLFLALGGWGNGFGGGGAAPYLYTAGNADVQRGFDQSAITSQLGALSAAVTNGFSDQAVSQCNQTTNILQGLNGIQNQISNDRFDTVSAITNTGYALNNTMMQNEMARQQCCCDTKQAIADLKFTVATENCADRAAVSDALRDVITNQTANTQAILDKMCAMELDGYKRENESLRTQLNMAALSASQTAQTAQLQAGNMAQTNYLLDALRPTPIPAYIVANPNTGTTTPATGA